MLDGIQKPGIILSRVVEQVAFIVIELHQRCKCDCLSMVCDECNEERKAKGKRRKRRMHVEIGQTVRGGNGLRWEQFKRGTV
jgi:hypothetical protein